MKKGENALEKSRVCAGFNKTEKLIVRGEAEKVFLASDADEAITARIVALCRAAAIPVDGQYHKKALGQYCGIEVGCAVAAVKKSS